MLHDGEIIVFPALYVRILPAVLFHNSHIMFLRLVSFCAYANPLRLVIPYTIVHAGCLK